MQESRVIAMFFGSTFTIKSTRFVLPKIFASLSVFAVLLLLVCMWLGFGLDLNKSVASWKMLQNEKVQNGGIGTVVDSALLREVNLKIEKNREVFRSQRQLGSVHILLGIGSSLFVVLVCSIAVTYFIGTGRWCREVVEAYGLAPEILQENQLLKRKSFPWALTGMLAVLGISALGAAADPGNGMENTAQWVVPHLFAALVGICVISYCLYGLWVCIVRNNEIINQVMQEVVARRRGLGQERPRENSSGVIV